VISNLTSTTIMSKITVAITGIVLVGYIIVHTLGNLQVFIGRETFNAYAESLHSMPALVWTVRVVFGLSIILHIIATLKLTALNRASKPINYNVTNHRKANVASKSMIYAGVALLFFVVYHLLHFTISGTPLYSEHGLEVYGALQNTRPDAYEMVVKGFRNPISAIVYVIAVMSLGMHLKHGIQSMFHTLGFHSNDLSAKLQTISAIVAIFVTAGLGSIPLTILLGLVGGDV